MRGVATALTLILTLVAFSMPASADHTHGNSDSVECPASLCYASAHVTAILPGSDECNNSCYCVGNGCYFDVSCGGTVGGLFLIEGSLICGGVNNDGVVDSTVGTDQCSDGPLVGDARCSMGVDDRYWVFTGSCRLAGVEVVAAGGGNAAARAGINLCVNGSGTPYFGQDPPL